MASSNQQKGGCLFGIGSILAVILSWKTSASVAWAILHFFFGWWYVFYWFIVHWER